MTSLPAELIASVPGWAILTFFIVAYPGAHLLRMWLQVRKDRREERERMIGSWIALDAKTGIEAAAAAMGAAGRGYEELYRRQEILLAHQEAETKARKEAHRLLEIRLQEKEGQYDRLRRDQLAVEQDFRAYRKSMEGVAASYVELQESNRKLREDFEQLQTEFDTLNSECHRLNIQNEEQAKQIAAQAGRIAELEITGSTNGSAHPA